MLTPVFPAPPESRPGTMKRALAAILLAAAASSGCAAQTNPASPGNAAPKYVRVVYQQQTPMALQTAIVRFASPGEPELVVDLVGAVHFADRHYFETLNRRLRQYDAVLYELVAPEGLTRPERSPDRSAFWQLLQTALGLTSQLQIIDYTAENFVHADMSPAEMEAAMKSRGDTVMTVALSAMADVLRQANISARNAVKSEGPSSIQPDNIIAFLTQNCRPLEIKRQLAVQFDQLGISGTSLGPTLDQLLVKDRNAAAMKVFRANLPVGNASSPFSSVPLICPTLRGGWRVNWG